MLLFMFLLAAALLGGSYYAYRVSFYSDPANTTPSPLVLNEQY